MSAPTRPPTTLVAAEVSTLHMVAATECLSSITMALRCRTVAHTGFHHHPTMAHRMGLHLWLWYHRDAIIVAIATIAPEAIIHTEGDAGLPRLTNAGM